MIDLEADQLVTDFFSQGIDSWSKLFAFLTTDFDTELGIILNNRAEAANLLIDLLAEQKRDNFYNNPQATNATREWIAGIDASNKSLLAANSTAQNLINGSVIELSEIARNENSGGFLISGGHSSDGYASYVSNAGDVNGDGLADLIVGIGDESSIDTYYGGVTLVVFGKPGGTTVEMSDLEKGNGGFVINGMSANPDADKFIVSGAGDVNGDGLDDLIVGVPLAPLAESIFERTFLRGASFVIFGKSNGAVVELSNIESGNGGFVINGASAGDISGVSVSDAGDVNGDGLADLIIGAPGDDPNGSYSGASFVVFGKYDGTAVELSNIENGNGGFVINGVSANDIAGYSVSGAGDVNGDGFYDLIIGAPKKPFDDPNGNESGTSFVVFGKSDGFAVELSDIENGNGGFVINGVSTFDRTGESVSSAGDVNGDGRDDLIIGAPDSSNTNGIFSGTSFVVFGKDDGTAVELSDIENDNGFVINGDRQSGYSVSSAGDVDGDGFADLIVGTRTDSQDASFVIFGGQSTAATIGTNGADTLNGDNSVNQLVAGTGDDTLVGNGGADVLRGGAGNDILAVSDLTFASLDGGTGIDTLRFDTALNLDLRTLADTKLDSIEILDLTNDGGNSTISLNLTDLLNLNEAQTASDTLVIHGNTGDIVNLDNSSNGQTGSWTNTGSGVYAFTAGDIGIIGTVTIDAGVTVNIVVTTDPL